MDEPYNSPFYVRNLLDLHWLYYLGRTLDSRPPTQLKQEKRTPSRSLETDLFSVVRYFVHSFNHILYYALGFYFYPLPYNMVWGTARNHLIHRLILFHMSNILINYYIWLKVFTRGCWIDDHVIERWKKDVVFLKVDQAYLPRASWNWIRVLLDEFFYWFIDGLVKSNIVVELECCFGLGNCLQSLLQGFDLRIVENLKITSVCILVGLLGRNVTGNIGQIL